MMKKAPCKNSNPLWGSHFSGGPADAMERINISIGFDKALWRQDIEASLAHARMLAKADIISSTEQKKIEGGLLAIGKEIESDRFRFKSSLEDIHMNIEARLAELIGEVAGKLHTARSRNDQVATDFRLWVRGAIDSISAQLKTLIHSLLDRAQEHTATLMPGFTHLQIAQPITLGHHLMAYVEMFGRDLSRLKDTRARMNESPLGSCALAGTSFPIDRVATAEALGFAQPMANSLDGVSDRDFALEFLSAASICAIHLSRLAEEIVLWSSAQFGFIRLSDAFTSGSSIMPQKRNPDAAELVRGKTGRIIGSLNSLLITLKGLPLAYNKDLQEDKEPAFDAADQLSLCLSAMTGMIADFAADKTRMEAAASQGYSTATDLADWLVQKLNIPFRQAHHITGRIVALAERKKLPLEKLTLADMQSMEKRITKDIFRILSAANSAASRVSQGGTSPKRVKEAIARARKRFA